MAWAAGWRGRDNGWAGGRWWVGGGGWSATWPGWWLDRFAPVIFILRANHALLHLNSH
jgi:hypothetical protein